MTTAALSPAPAPRPTHEVRTRVIIGLILALLAVGILVGDWQLELASGQRLYPFLMLGVVGMAALGAVEMHQLLADHPRPPAWLLVTGCCAVLLASWPAHLGWTGPAPQPARDVALAFAAVVLVGFLYEMWHFRAPDRAVLRLALFTWVVAYLGLLPSFIVLLRWSSGATTLAGVTALALVIFVPKCGDVGAFFTGRALGRHRMTPALSPKKTWEGFAGGLALSVLVAVVLNRVGARLLGDDLYAAAFGIGVGLAGVLGDLAESLIKRDCRQKDAAHLLPAFGGVLDVIDSILFAGPIAYLWLCCG